MFLSRISKKTQAILAIGVLVLVSGLGIAYKTGKLKIGAIYGPPVPGVTGTIRDISGNPVSGVKVYEVRNPSKYALSQADGRFGIMDLPVGENTLVFQKNGTGYGTLVTDVPTTHWAYWEINALIKTSSTYFFPINIVYGQQVYQPSNPAKRSFVAQAICNSLPLEPYLKAEPTFRDVPKTYSAYGSIEALNRAGIMGGYPDGTFKPDASLTRDQLAVILYRALKLQNTDKFGQTFPDVPENHWAYREIETLVEQNIIFGETSGNFNPSGVVNRDALAVFIIRSFKNIVVSQGGFDSQIRTFSLGDNTRAVTDIYITPCGQVGKVTGVVKDSSGQALVNVKVTLSLEPSIDKKYIIQTDANGNYTFFNIPKGYYQYFVSGERGKLYSQTDVMESNVYVDTGKTTTLDILDLTL